MTRGTHSPAKETTMSNRSDANEPTTTHLETTEETGEGASTLPELTPALLRRLGEAAAGFPDEKRRWWTLRLNPADGNFDPNEHDSEDLATSFINGKSGYGVIGPVVAPFGPGGIVQTHVTRVTIDFDQGPSLTLDGKDYDAVFWGWPAVEKFVIPYYVSVSGIDYGKKIVAAAAEGDMLLAHAPDTEYRIYHLPAGRFIRALEPLV
jgi:hypothetical protein